MSNENTYHILLPNRERMLAESLIKYTDQKESSRELLPLGRKIFSADKFFKWLFTPANGYVGIPEKKRSNALIIMEEFIKTPLIEREMGRVEVIHYFHYQKAKNLVKK